MCPNPLPHSRYHNFKGYVAALLATIIWAGNFVASRALADQIPPFQFNFWRWVIAFIVLLPFSLRHFKRNLRIVRSDFKYFSIMAFLGVTLLNTFVYKAGQTTESLNMALIMPATPIVIMLLARIFYSEKIDFFKLSCIFLSLTGVLFLVFKGDFEKLKELDFTSGDLWTIAGMFCFAIYSFLMRKKPSSIGAVEFNFFIFGIGLVYTLPFVLAEIHFYPITIINWQIITGILYSGIGCSALAFLLWTIGVENIGAVSAAIVYYSLPVFAAIMGFFILDEKIVFSQIIGGILITTGILLATLSQTRRF